MTDYPNRLIEVDLPIKRISAHARREKSIRHGHISTLHIWWARRPLAACRAVLCAALWPDPADPRCPQSFRGTAARLMQEFAFTATRERSVADLCHPVTWGKLSALRQPEGALDPTNPDHLNFLRYLLLDFIADFSNWDASTEPHYLESARALTQTAHEALGGIPGTRPLVVDPFAGGGAIPLEALRIGADAFASDLNPVAVLLNKVVLEYIPRYGQRLADEVRQWGQWVKDQVKEELAEFYPKDPDGATPIAYLWARTITCEGPGCGSEVPLMRGLWLAKRKKHSIALQMISNLQEKRADFVIIENVHAEDVGNGTVGRGSATCPVCGYTTPVASVRRQLKERRGGASAARLYAVVITLSGQKGRFYRLPTERDLEIVRKTIEELERRKTAHAEQLSLVPDEPTPPGGGSGAGRAFSQRNYGMDRFEDLFTPRQLLALSTLARLVNEAGALCEESTQDSSLAVAVQVSLALSVNKIADLGNSMCPWEPVAECPRNLFARQTIPVGWNFAEGVPVGESSGSWTVMMDRFYYVMQKIGSDWNVSTPQKASATKHPLPNDSAQAFVTDPPYYDAVPYADLSDFFYVWFRRSMRDRQLELLASDLTPKNLECIVDGVKGKDKAYFETTMSIAMSEGQRVLSPEGIGTIVFAHKTTAGWEAQLQAMINAGWTVTGSWPIDTEMASRFRARDSAALGSSVHIVCRPRVQPQSLAAVDDVGEWRDVLSELPGRIHEWMPRLAQEGIVGADAIFACLGPALEIYSRYARVERADGTPVPLGDVTDDRGRVVERGYLSHVWEAVSREALSMIFEGADTAGFEPDARLTAMWLWTLSTASDGNGTEDEGKVIRSTGYTLEYDAARKIAQGLGAHLERLGALVEVKGDKARLLPVVERTRVLFGKEGSVSAPRGRRQGVQQLSLFGELEAVEEESGLQEFSAPPAGQTVLDRVHQAMLLFGAGRSEALRRFLVDEGVGGEARFWRLAQALSALYPSQTDEKRWVDGVLARKVGLGF